MVLVYVPHAHVLHLEAAFKVAHQLCQCKSKSLRTLSRFALKSVCLIFVFFFFLNCLKKYIPEELHFMHKVNGDIGKFNSSLNGSVIN